MRLGFNLVGYGCTTCIGNSGPLPEIVSPAIAEGDLVVSSVLSGNRNFEGRVHPEVRANYLASPAAWWSPTPSPAPPDIDLSRDSLGVGKPTAKPVSSARHLAEPRRSRQPSARVTPRRHV